jgi:hypothetical protein
VSFAVKHVLLIEWCCGVVAAAAAAAGAADQAAGVAAAIGCVSCVCVVVCCMLLYTGMDGTALFLLLPCIVLVYIYRR